MSASRRRAAQQALLVVAAFVTGSTTVAAPARGQTLVWSTGGRMQIGYGVEADIRVVFVKGEFRVTGEGGRYAAPQCVVPFDFSLSYSVYTVSARCTPYNVSATFRLSDRQQSGGRVGFTLSVAGEAIGDNLLWKDYKLSYTWNVSGNDPVAAPPQQSGTAIERDCFNRIQGQISWDARGTTSWVDSNVENLCRGTEVATAPGYCFTTARHGQIDRRDGTAWDWPDAIRLCAGTSNEAATLQCFKDAVGQGMAVVPAIDRCRKQ